MFKHIVLVISLVVLVGCASSFTKWDDPQAIAQKITAQYDNFKGQTLYTGPSLGTMFESTFIRAWKPKAGVPTYQIYVSINSFEEGHNFLQEAYDSNTNQLEVVIISHEKKDCGYAACQFKEDIGVTLSQQYMEGHIQSGIEFQLRGRDRNKVYKIPSTYIKAMLDVVK